MLLQQRSFSKYHSGGLWTNTCCSHPRRNESFIQADHRRLNEEMGMSANLEKAFCFIYKASLSQNLIEHELDWVFLGKTDALPLINNDEVASYKYVDFNFLLIDLKENPDLYTAWLKICINSVAEHITNTKYFEK
jgi:isopentenyl-diphosphate delta-isomerase